MEILLETVPQQQKGYLLQEMDGEILLYHTADVTTSYLNPSAALIWQHCDGEHSVQAIITELTRHFPDAADLHQDVLRTLEDFCSRNLVELL